MLRPENVASPLAAACEVMPESAPPPGLLPIASDTVALDDVTRLPPRSLTSTWMSGLIGCPGTVFDGGTRNPTVAADPTATLNGVDVAPLSPEALAARVYPVPALSTLRLLNVATPLAAACVVVPDSAAAFALFPNASVTELFAVVTRFPPASCTSTCTAGRVAPPVVPLGSAKNARRVAPPTTTSNAFEVAAVNPAVVAASVYPLPILSTCRSGNVATPATAATLSVPERTPLPALLAIAIVTAELKSVAVFPCASRAVIFTAGLIAAVAVVWEGCCVNTRIVTAPG